jgi:hypothetical protein
MTADDAPDLRESFQALAVRQHELMTRAQLLSLGINDMAMYRRVRSGQWLRLLPAVYAVRNGEISDEQRRIAAALYAGEAAQLAGLSALDWYGFRYVPDHDSVYLIVPHQRQRKSAGFVRIHRTHAVDLRARDGGLYRVCSPARAVVDAGRELRDSRAVLAIVAECVQRGFAGVRVLDEQLRRAARSRTALVRAALDEVSGGVRSVAEGDLRANVQRSKVLPPVLWNVPLWTPSGERLPTPDGWLGEVGIALEMDSQEFHYRPEDWAKTLQRHNMFAKHGVLALHFTPKENARNPDKVLRTIEETYLERKAAGVIVEVLTRWPA